MTNDNESNQPRSFVTSWLPWLLALLMLTVYALTLNHWVSVGNLRQVAELYGLGWRPNLFGTIAPLGYLLTYPLRCLPPSAIPLALNLFAAVCAALSLALLARSVALLPHDRTYDQRLREVSECSLLTIPLAWLPPLFAVLVCGLQLTFWEHAVEGTNEMINLLLFASLIRCLLEYRIDGRESWLNRFALAYGLSIANNWGMIGFAPAFLVALIWIRGISFFNLSFLLKNLTFWAAGIALLLLMPTIAALSSSHAVHAGFWASLRYVLVSYKVNLIVFPRKLLLLVCLTSVLPVFVIGIRWASFFGDTSPLGIFVATAMFHVVHALFLFACLWVALDAPFSPRGIVNWLPCLSFYYLGALSIGYFSGYFLLVFGTNVAKARYRPPPFVRFLGRCVTVTIFVLLIGSVTLLVYRNLPRIEANDGRALRSYFSLLQESLPQHPAVVLSDDPFRLLVLQALMKQQGNNMEHLMIHTASLWQDPGYFDFLKHKYPGFNLSTAMTNQVEDVTDPLVLIRLMDNLSKTHEIYYLHPSFGYYFEEFYAEPHGLVYRLRPYADNTAAVPRATPELIEENQAFWQKTGEKQFPEIVSSIAKPAHPARQNVLDRIIKGAHLLKEPDLRAQMAGAYYSRVLNYWGVELQRCGMKTEAAERFSQATSLNPQNVAAQINLDFNRDLQDGKPPALQPSQNIEDRFGLHRSWVQIMGQDGPVDEPTFCYVLGETFFKGGLYREAIQQFTRVHAFVPDDLATRLWLAQLYLYTRSSSNAVAQASAVLRTTPDDPNALFLESVGYMQLKAYDHAIAPLTHLLDIQTNNVSAQLNRAIAYYQLNKYDDSRRDYEAAGKTVTNSYQIYYGLAQIAYLQKDTNAAIRNYQLYLTNAPANPVEIKQVTDRLKELKSPSN